MLSGALRQLFALSEAYPDLKANANFQQLQAELTDIENKIAASRRFFNNAVQEYNTGIQRFPAALFASSFGFAPKEFFDLGEERKTVGRGAAGEVLSAVAPADDAQTLGNSACPAPPCGEGSGAAVVEIFIVRVDAASPC